MVVLHGYGEFCDRYENFCMYFAKQGILVFSYDHRGWGKTGQRNSGQLGNMGKYSEVYDTVKFMLDRVKIPGKPLHLFGHSMGGGIALGYCADTEYAKDLSTVIASAPALAINPKVGPPAVVVTFLRTLTLLLQNTPFRNIPFRNKLETALLTSDEGARQAYDASPYNHDISTIGVLEELLRKGEECSKEGAKRFVTPVLLLQADGDEICDVKGADEFFSNLPESLEKKYDLYKCDYHEIFNEQEFKERFYKSCSDWINAHL
ncbi:putative monoglyceride lipase [Zancudomyces culisetae]|uniref:Putative monoglyceride lipase n=1 Tax=Zancudomyces culisetae TaxID=1213189 RepID=A0A1R1PVW6_ZANCU|nr:putative monoglyceride lipase [Zancudomyces culisetae]|eukprot:OMH85116.1 putative monoglyceride lipase [Zancudomyces culisetae]